MYAINSEAFAVSFLLQRKKKWIIFKELKEAPIEPTIVIMLFSIVSDSLKILLLLKYIMLFAVGK
jgi:hypothetical protein